MFSYNRLNEIFNYITRIEYIPASKLASLLNITDRTIRSDITNINETLKNHGAVIQLKRKSGYYLEVTDEKLYQDFIEQLNNDNNIELDSSQDRLNYILYTLLYTDEYISLDDLANSVYITKNTIQNYIKSIKEILLKYDLEYIAKQSYGIKVIGNEDNKRKCILENILSYDFENYIIGFTANEYLLFEGIDLNLLKEIIINNLSKEKIKTNDFNLKNIIIHFALMISRILNDYYIPNNKEIIIDNNNRQFIEELTNEIEKEFNIIISEGEKKYLYLHLISNSNFADITISDLNIKSAIEVMLESIYNDYNFDLRNDEILIKDLFNHFKSIFLNKTYSLNKRNPLLNTIKTNFPLAFDITLTTTSKIFNIAPYILNEDEVGYVSLHIGAAIERCFTGTIQRKNVILVCGSGQATTRMLEARMNIYFNDKINIVRRASYNEFISYSQRELQSIDFVVSTIPLKSDLIKTITVDFSLKQRDIEQISQYLATISQDKIKKVNPFFNKKTYLSHPNITSKNELIKQMCQLLQDNDIVDETYYQSVLTRESLSNTNMNEVFAIPHSMDVLAKKTQVAVAILDKPILWNNNETVQIVFMLAVKNNDQHNIEHLYDLFIEIVNNTRLQQRIIKTSSFNKFIEVLGEISYN